MPPLAKLIPYLNGPSWQVNMEIFAKCKLRILTKCFRTLSLLEKHWKQRISTKHNANFVWRHWIVPLINHLNVIKFYAIHVKTLRHTNCGGMKTSLRKCWSTMIGPCAKVRLEVKVLWERLYHIGWCINV